MLKSHIRPTVTVKELNVTITTLSEYISYKMTPGSEKDYRASSNTSFILSVVEWPPQALTGGEACPAFFLLLELTFWTPFGF
jgi:hypothetical protein